MKKILFLAAALIMSIGAWAQTTYDLSLKVDEGNYYRGINSTSPWTLAWLTCWKSNDFNLGDTETTKVYLDTNSDAINNMYNDLASNGAHENHMCFQVRPNVNNSYRPLVIGLTNSEYKIKKVSFTLKNTVGGPVTVIMPDETTYTCDVESSDQVVSDYAVNATTLEIGFEKTSNQVRFSNITVTVEKIGSTEPTTNGYVTSLDQLSNDKVYLIRSYRRGWWTAKEGSDNIWQTNGLGDNGAAFTSDSGKAQNAEDPDQQWAILTSNGHYYLYNIGQKKFFVSQSGYTNNSTKATLSATVSESDAVDFEDKFDVITGSWKSTNPEVRWGVSMTVNSTVCHFAVTNWSGQSWQVFQGNGDWSKNNDEGLYFAIEAVADIDPAVLAEAMNTLNPAGPTDEEIAELQAQLEEVMDWDGPIMNQKVGYPAWGSQSVQTLYGFDKVTAENYEEVVAALEAVKVETEVNLPVEGKSYYIRPFYNAQTSGYLYDNGSRLSSSTTEPASGAVFVVTRVNGNQMALKVSGTDNYLRWTQGNDGTAKSNPNTGYSTYDATYSTQTILKAVTTQEKGGPVNQVAGVTNADLYGLLEINGMGTDGKSYFLVNRADGAFVAGNHDDKYYDNTANGRTVYYAFEEVTEGAAYELEIGATGYSTLYLDQNVEIPANVEVYYCTQEEESKLAATAFESNDVIPSYVGVVVKGTPNTTYKFPYTEAEYEGGVDFEDVSVLDGVVASTPTSAVYYSTVYVLSQVDSQIGFYKFAGENLKACRAYYGLYAGENVQGFVLNFGGEQTTGIESLIQKSENGISFDLAGRRVNANVKGISIVNNKKVIK